MKKNLHIVLISFIFSIILWVSISLSSDYYTTFEVPVKLVDFPEGYSTGASIPQKVSIKIKGKGWKLLTVDLTSGQNYIVPVGTQPGKRKINLLNDLSENSWLSSDLEVINISPDTVSINVEKIINKKVPIIQDLKLKFKNGYGIASPVVIVPDSTTVYGPISYVNRLNSVQTEPLGTDELDGKIVKNVPLRSIFGMSFSDNYVKVTVDAQRIVEKNFDNVVVNLIDVPGDRNVVLIPNRISVGLRGGIDVLGKLDTNSFNAYVNYRDVVLDTLGGVAPNVVLPENTSVIFIKPNHLRYIIKKF